MPIGDAFDWLGQNGSWLGPLVGGAIGAAGSGGTNTTTQGVAPEFAPLASAVAQRGADLGNMAYQPYNYNRTANFNPYQFAGFDMTAQRAQQQGGLPQQAEAALGNVLSGGSMGRAQSNPYADSMNAYNGAQTGVGSNPYAGSNPYLEQNIQNTLGDVSRNYNQNVAPSMAATAYKSGSFGNSGQQEMENESRSMLQRNMGRISSDMRMQDYGMQQGLAESDINRRMQARQGDLSRNASVYGQDLSRNAGTYGQQMGLNQQGFEAGQSRMMQGLGYAPSVYGLGYQPAQQMLGIGATMQQQGQNVLNNQYDNYQQAQNWPFRTYDAMLAPFSSRAVGSSTTSPGSSPAAGLLGGAMIGSQLWGGTPPPNPGNQWQQYRPGDQNFNGPLPGP